MNHLRYLIGGYHDYVKFKDDNNKWHLFRNVDENLYYPMSPLGLYNEVEEWNPNSSNLISEFNKPISNVKQIEGLKVEDKPIDTNVLDIPTGSGNFEIFKSTIPTKNC